MRTLIVVAHYDDETIGAAAELLRNPGSVTLLYATNSGPRASRYWEPRGFSSSEAYAAARRAELECALAGLPVRNIRVLPVPDQEAVYHLENLVQAIQEESPHADQILTHAYEGGHPDHDTCALACQLAGSGLPLLEMPYYRSPQTGELDAPFVACRFLQNPLAGATQLLELNPEESEAKRRMLACFQTQSGVLERFTNFAFETRRVSPPIHLATPPHPGTLYYETRGGTDFTAWSAAACAAADRPRRERIR
jgi:LmbE family N-acetylglucosaminyl deacetylase